MNHADLEGAWRKQVERELKGKSYDDYLIWKSLDRFSIESWQDKPPEHIPSLPPLTEPWKITEPVYETDAQAANARALEALMNGAESIWFFKAFKGAAAEVAKKDIDTSIAPVFFSGDQPVDAFRSFLKEGTNPEIPSGQLLMIDGRRLRERGCSIIDEVALIIAQALFACDKVGFDHPPLFVTGTGTAFLTEIAKLRALRWLWSSILVK